ncbi:MAG: DEAD/DEAH box helicase [Armatimonadota bacterium]
MDVDAFVREISNQRHYEGQIAHVERLAPREPQFGELTRPMHERVKRVLAEDGIERLYTHQVSAIEAVRRGEDVVVVTSTASGKSLCYHIPVLEELLTDRLAKAVYLFPTKALAQDQLRGLNRFKESDPDLPINAGTYDGDTPANMRRTLRDEGNVILTNPDMLHSGILPNHSRWAQFFASLRFVVVDEIHSYRGVFGSGVANVLRRLDRICRHYNSRPQYICCSATIANPAELARRLTNREMTLVDNDGSPRGPKQFVLWNPPYLDEGKVERKSPNAEAQRLMTELIVDGVQTITFVRARVLAELIYRHCQDQLAEEAPRLRNKIRAYRGGYMAEDRREIERQLFSGELLGVTSTNALELGIDIGSLDACIIVGYPGTIASTWQQAGRAGRGEEESLAVLVGHNSPIDQYLMQHPQYFFGQSPEHAIIDPENPHVLAGHLACAANELPIEFSEETEFGEFAPAVLELLEESGQVRRLGGRWYWKGASYPAAKVPLRTIDENNYTIHDQTDPDDVQVIGEVDEFSAYTLLHPQAIYMHNAETYFVHELDLTKKTAHVTRENLDYYTQAVSRTDILVDETETEKKWRITPMGFGEVTVTTLVYMFRKIKFFGRDSIGFGNLDLPPHKLDTVAMWLMPPRQVLQRVLEYHRVPGDGLLGIANVMAEVLPIFAMCDTMDIGSVVDSTNMGTPSIFIFDRYPGGVGYAERCYEMIEQVMEACLLLIQECGCEEGCPSCVGSPLPAYAQQDPDGSSRDCVPDKDAALMILHDLLEKVPYIPRDPSPERRRLIDMGLAAVEVPMAEDEEPPREIKRLPENVEAKILRRIRSLKK